MNLKTTPLFFGLLLGILWLFGLMLVYKRGAVDENLIMTTMGPDAKVDTVIVKYGGDKKDKDNDELVFLQENDLWYLKRSGVSVRVEGFRIEDMIRQVKDAKRYEEDRVQDNVAFYGLPPADKTPRITVILKGKVKEREKEWKFYVGKAGSADLLVYVNSSDRSGRAYPILRSSIDALFFKNTPELAELRSKRLFDIVEPTVTRVAAADGKEELALKKLDKGWRFVKPKELGFAGFEPAAGTTDDTAKKEKDVGGVKSLINAITAIHVDSDQDFEPIGAKSLADYGLKEGEETMRLALGSGADQDEKKEDKKDDKAFKADKKENKVLLVGKPVPRTQGKKSEDQYYGRMLGDEGVFRIGAKALEPVKEAVHDPKRIRSTNVVLYDPKKVDAVVLTLRRPGKDDKGKDTTIKDEVKLLHPADKDWQVISTGDKLRQGQRQGHQHPGRRARGQEGDSGVRRRQGR